MTRTDFDPETARLEALSTLRAWARQRDRMPEQRANLLAAAWRAGERNIRELARVADVTRQTVYADLENQGIDPSRDRSSGITPPRASPLNHEQVADLAEHMSTVLGSAMLCAEPEPLAKAAWMAHKAIYAIAQLLNPDPTEADEQAGGGGRAGWLDTIADCADHIRRGAHQQWASEATPAELARFTEHDAITRAEIGTGLLVNDATLNVLLPDGMTSVHVTLSNATWRDPEPEGWTTWSSDNSLPLAPVDGARHLEIHALLMGLSEVITQHALHPELLEER